MKLKLFSIMTAFLLVCLAPAALAGPGVGSPAPDFTLKDVNGNDHSLSDYAGKVLLLNFWASW